MTHGFFRFSILAACFSLVSYPASAQEVVHALTGTVNNINQAAKTITVVTDDGSAGTFSDLAASHGKVDLDKGIRADAVPADDFKQRGAHVIVYYYGFGSSRTVVALRNLGPGPFTKTDGTVVKFDKGEHSVIVKDQSGATKSFKLTEDTVADTGTGAVDGHKFDPPKGDHVLVISKAENGEPTALCISEL